LPEHRHGELPAPAVPQVTSPGLALARAINSVTLRGAKAGWTTSREELNATSDTGAKSRATWKLRLR
jgi:hypothetical protein